MYNQWMKNFLNGNYHSLSHKYLPDERLRDYKKVIIVGLDSASNRIFVACLEHDIYPYGYCNVLDEAFPYWAENFNFMKSIQLEECESDPGCALVMSKFAYQALGGRFSSDVYLVTAELDDPIFHDNVRCFYRLNDPDGFDSAAENDLGNYVSLASTGAFKSLSLETIAFRYSCGKRIMERLSQQSDTQFLFLVTGAVGDNTAVCCMVEEYKRRFGYKRVAVLVQDNRAEIAEMFPAIDEIISCQRLDMICLANYFILNYAYGQRDFGNVVFTYYMPASLRWAGFVHEERDYKLTLFPKFREFMGLPLDAKPSKPNVEQAPPDDRYKDAVLLIPGGRAACRDLGIDSEAVNAFFDKLADELRGKGLRVYMNGLKNDEKYVYMSLTELAAWAPKFRAIISFPSGIGELLNLTPCRLIHVWPEEMRYNMERFKDYSGYANATHSVMNHAEVKRIVHDICCEMG